MKIYFVYQEPKDAWRFVKKREQVEGRVVPKESFAKQFVASRVVVNKIKQIFKEKVSLTFVLKTVEESGKVRKESKFNVESVDGYIDKVYTDSKDILLLSY